MTLLAVLYISAKQDFEGVPDEYLQEFALNRIEPFLVALLYFLLFWFSDCFD